MNFDRFVGQVQHRARLGSLGEAVCAIRATLSTLGERLTPGEVKDLASQLPEEIAYYTAAGVVSGNERFSVDEFFERVAARERVDPPIAIFHARVVFEVLREAVSAGEIEDVLQELPADFRQVMISGSTGRLRLNRSRAERPAAREGRPVSVTDKKTVQSLPRARSDRPAKARHKPGRRHGVIATERDYVTRTE